VNAAFQLVLFPGLGADARLFEPQQTAFPQLVVPPWIPPLKNESLPAYAARLARTMVVSRDKPLILGGVSFGGMVAYEVARHLKPDAVVLIASCRTRHGLRLVYRAASCLMPLIPLQAWSIAKLLASPVVGLVGKFRPVERTVSVAMFKEMDSSFMHWVVRAILGWHPAPLEGIRVFQIHGRRDLLIPARRVEADVVIPGGGHMINMTHAEEVNDFIKRAAAIGHELRE